MKTDSSGNSQWGNTFGECGSAQYGYSVQQTSDGGYIVAGSSIGVGGGYVSLIKTDSTGNIQWQKTFGTSHSEGGSSVQQTSDGGYIIAGWTNSFGAWLNDVYLIKTDSAGNLQWQKTFGGNGQDSGSSVQQTSDGGFIIAGTTSSFGAGSSDVYLIKTDSAGNKIWEKTFGGSSDDEGRSLQQTTDGGYIIVGSTSSFGSGSSDVYLIKLDPGVIKLKRFEINQCFQEVNEIDGYTQKYDLIETKPFVVRVNLERDAPGTTTANVKLSIVNVASGKQISTIKEKKDAIIKYGSSEPVDFLFKDNETQDMKAGDYRFSLVVEDNKGTKLLDWSNIYTFKATKTMRILVVPRVIYNLKYIHWDDSYINLVEKVFPIPKNKIEIEPVLALPVVSGAHSIVLEMELLGIFALCYMNDTSGKKPDFICAVVPEGALGKGVAGEQVGPVVLIEEFDRADLTLGHEIGHFYGLGEEAVKTEDMPIDSTDPPWEINQSFRFDRNPPPLVLSDDGNYIIKRLWDPYNDRKCEEEEEGDINPIHPGFDWEYSKDWLGREVRYRWCPGKYVQEGGYDVYDVEVGKQIPNAEQRLWYSMMSSLSSPNTWISGPEYAWLIKELVDDNGATGTNLLAIRTTASSQVQNRKIIRGFVNISEKTADLSPLIQASNLELTPEVAEPNCQLAFLSKTMVELGTFNFIPLEREGSSLERPFFLVVDIPVDTAFIKVAIDGVIAAELRLTDNSPTVQVLSPNGGEQVGGQLCIAWSASDMDGDKLKYIIEFSNNNGAKWSPIAIDQNATELAVDSNYLPGGNNCLVKVIASDGWNRSEDTSDAPFSITTKPPKVTILEPASGTILLYSTNMQGRCTVYDPETGYVTDVNAILWSSNIDGFLGKGNLIGFRLSLGNHILSVTATDPEGKSSTGTVKVTIVANRADFNNDLIVNLPDLSEFTAFWLENCSEPNWCKGCDLNRSGRVNYIDFAIFADNWMFTFRPPEAASNPNPANGATGVSINVVLNWTAGSGATSHDVYFGTQSPGTFRGNQTQTSFTPGSLNAGKYYWRIDEVNSDGKTIGVVWSFTAGKVLCFPSNTLVWADDGLVKISEVMPGQKITAAGTLGKAKSLGGVESVQEHEGTFKCYDIAFENGNCISVADNHYFLLDSDLWVSVHELTRGLRLKSLNGPVGIIYVVKRAMPVVGKVYNLKIKDSDRYFVGKDGIIARDY